MADPFEQAYAGGTDPFEAAYAEKPAATSDPFEAAYAAPQPADHFEAAYAQPHPPHYSWYNPARLVPTAIRGVGALGSGLLSAEPGPGTLAGGAVSGGADLLAQGIERATGQRPEGISTREAAAQAAIGMLPFGAVASRIGGGAAARIAEAGALGATGASIGAYGRTGELPSPGEAATGAVVGAGLGAAGEGLGKAGRAIFGNYGEQALPEGVQGIEQGAVKRGIGSTIQAGMDPANLTPEARSTQDAISEQLGNVRIYGQVAKKQASDSLSYLDSVGPVGRRAFIDKFVNGAALSPDEEAVAKTLTSISDPNYEELSKLPAGAELRYVQNYLPGIYKPADQARASEILSNAAARGEMTGAEQGQIRGLFQEPGGAARVKAGFLRDKTFQSILDAEKAGLAPITDNAVELQLVNAIQQRRFIALNNIGQELLDKGLLKSTGPMVGGADVDPAIARALGYDALSGSAPAVRLLNNAFRPGLSDNPIASPLLGVVSKAAQAQVSLAGYHALNTVLGHTASAIGESVSGAFSALRKGDIGEAGANLMRGVPGVALVQDIGRYLKARGAAGEAGFSGALEGDLATMAKAGGGFDASFADQLGRGLRLAVQDNATAIPKEMLKTVIDATSAPIMRGIVPALKIGFFLNQVERDIARLQPKTEEEMRRLLQQRWATGDSIFGQLISDNLGISKGLRDALHFAIGFPGWNIGSSRIIGGTVRAGYRGLTGGTVDEAASQATKFALGLTTTMAVAGSILHRAMTGEWPATWVDAFYPKTGNKLPSGKDERIQLPGYLRDAVAIGGNVHKPGDLVANIQRTVGAKESPLIRTASELVHNMDFYGVRVVDPNADIPEQAGQVAGYLANQFTPFSLRGTVAPYLGRETPPNKLSLGKQLIGLGNAPQFLDRTPAEQALAEIQAQHMGAQGPISPEDFAKRQGKRQLRESLREGSATTPDIQAAERAGTISKREQRKLERSPQSDPFVERVNALSAPDFVKVWQQASAEERQKLQAIARKKVVRARVMGDTRALQAYQAAGIR